MQKQAGLTNIEVVVVACIGFLITVWIVVVVHFIHRLW